MNERAMQFRVGVVFLATLFLLGIMWFLVSDKPLAWTRGSYDIHVKFPQAPNVSENTPVQKSGILIGRVGDVELLDDGGVVVTLRINEDRRLRQNETFQITSSLLGDAIVEVVPSRVAGAPTDYLEPGAEIEGRVSVDVTEVIRDMHSAMVEVTGTVNKAGDALAAASIDMGKAARSVSGLLDDNQAELEKALNQANRTMVALELAAKSAYELVGDEETKVKIKQAMQQLPEMLMETRGTIQRMQTTMDLVDKNLKNMEGFTGMLGDQRLVERLDRTTQNLDRLMQDMTTFSQALADRDGSLGRFVHDPDLYNHLNRAAQNVDELTRKMKPVVDDARRIMDRVARDPGGQVGVRSVLTRGTATKY